MADGTGHRTHTVAVGVSGPTDFEPYEWRGKPQRQFVARLQCTESPSCPESEHARTWVRSLRFTVADSADPEVEVGLDLLEGGWLKGEFAAFLSATDEGVGLADLRVEVNDGTLVDMDPSCPDRFRRAFVQLSPMRRLLHLRRPIRQISLHFETDEQCPRMCHRFCGEHRCSSHQSPHRQRTPGAVFRDTRVGRP